MESNSTPRRPVRTRALEGAVAVAVGLGAVSGSYAAVGADPTFLAAPVAGWVTALTPDAVITWAILTLGSLGQSLGFALALGVSIVGVGVVAAGSRALARATDADPLVRHALTVLAVGAVTLVLTGGLLSAVGAALGAGVVSLSAHRLRPTAPARTDRRGFLRAVAAAAAVTGAGALLGTRSGTDSATSDVESATTGGDTDPMVDDLLATASARTLDLPDLDPLVSREFYQVDINSVDPDLSVAAWSLRLTGAVDEPRAFDYDELTSLPAEHRFVTLQCVGDGLNGKKIDTALWTGVPIADLLPDLPDECCVMLRAADDYYEEFPMEALRNGFIAYRMNGRPLPRGHGYPVRALIPGHWGEINVKWLTEIEVLEEPVDGYWEERGWHGTGPVNTVAKLHSVSSAGDDGRVRVGGHAYAGTRGIERVEVSTDGGTSWAEATLSEPLPGAVDARTGEARREEAEDAWRMWAYEYAAADPHEVVVRAVDGTGQLQEETERRAFPRGPTGWVSRRVDPRRL